MINFEDFREKLDHFKNNIMNNSLGIKRKDMPQIAEKDIPGFLKWLKSEHKIDSRKTKVRVGDIRMTQSEMDFDKVLGIRQKGRVLDKPVIISKDGYLLDGHHRVAAMMLMNENKKLEVQEVDLAIRSLLEVASMYAKSFTRNLNENEQLRMKKVRARQLLRNALRRGDIERKPCEKCGSKYSEAHHQNYDNPTKVRWWCKACHEGVHTARGC